MKRQRPDTWELGLELASNEKAPNTLFQSKSQPAKTQATQPKAPTRGRKLRDEIAMAKSISAGLGIEESPESQEIMSQINAEKELASSIMNRERYIVRLKSLLTCTPTASTFAEIGELLLLLRIAAVETTEAIVEWRLSTGQGKNRPYLWEQTNYVQKMASDLDFLDDSSILTEWVGFSLRRNPLLLSDANLDTEIRAQRAQLSMRKQLAAEDDCADTEEDNNAWLAHKSLPFISVASTAAGSAVQWDQRAPQALTQATSSILPTPDCPSKGRINRSQKVILEEEAIHGRCANNSWPNMLAPLPNDSVAAAPTAGKAKTQKGGAAGDRSSNLRIKILNLEVAADRLFTELEQQTALLQKSSTNIVSLEDEIWWTNKHFSPNAYSPYEHVGAKALSGDKYCRERMGEAQARAITQLQAWKSAYQASALAARQKKAKLDRMVAKHAQLLLDLDAFTASVKAGHAAASEKAKAAEADRSAQTLRKVGNQDRYAQRQREKFKTWREEERRRLEAEEIKTLGQSKKQIRNRGKLFEHALKKIREKANVTGHGTHLQQVFSNFDLDGDGSLSRDEFAKGLKFLGAKLRIEEVAAVFSILDPDGDDAIDYGEFADAFYDHERALADAEAEAKLAEDEGVEGGGAPSEANLKRRRQIAWSRKDRQKAAKQRAQEDLDAHREEMVRAIEAQRLAAQEAARQAELDAKQEEYSRRRHLEQLPIYRKVMRLGGEVHWLLVYNVPAKGYTPRALRAVAYQPDTCRTVSVHINEKLLGGEGYKEPRKQFLGWVQLLRYEQAGPTGRGGEKLESRLGSLGMDAKDLALVWRAKPEEGQVLLDASAAATTLQSRFRGHLARKKPTVPLEQTLTIYKEDNVQIYGECCSSVRLVAHINGDRPSGLTATVVAKTDPGNAGINVRTVELSYEVPMNDWVGSLLLHAPDELVPSTLHWVSGRKEQVQQQVQAQLEERKQMEEVKAADEAADEVAKTSALVAEATGKALVAKPPPQSTLTLFADMRQVDTMAAYDGVESAKPRLLKVVAHVAEPLGSSQSDGFTTVAFNSSNGHRATHTVRAREWVQNLHVKRIGGVGGAGGADAEDQRVMTLEWLLPGEADELSKKQAKAEEERAKVTAREQNERKAREAEAKARAKLQADALTRAITAAAAAAVEAGALAASLETEKTSEMLALVGMLKLTVVGAAGLGKADTAMFGGGASDPYCVVRWCGHEIGRTRVIQNDVHPKWDELFEMSVPKDVVGYPVEGGCSLHIEVYDKDLVGADDFLGEVMLEGDKLLHLPPAGVVTDFVLQKKKDTEGEGEDENGKKKNKKAGKQKLVKGKLSLCFDMPEEFQKYASAEKQKQKRNAKAKAKAAEAVNTVPCWREQADAQACIGLLTDEQRAARAKGMSDWRGGSDIGTPPILLDAGAPYLWQAGLHCDAAATDKTHPRSVMVVCSRLIPDTALEHFEASLRTYFAALNVCDFTEVSQLAVGAEQGKAGSLTNRLMQCRLVMVKGATIGLSAKTRTACLETIGAALNGCDPQQLPLCILVSGDPNHCTDSSSTEEEDAPLHEELAQAAKALKTVRDSRREKQAGTQQDWTLSIEHYLIGEALITRALDVVLSPTKLDHEFPSENVDATSFKYAKQITENLQGLASSLAAVDKDAIPAANLKVLQQFIEHPHWHDELSHGSTTMEAPADASVEQAAEIVALQHAATVFGALRDWVHAVIRYATMLESDENVIGNAAPTKIAKESAGAAANGGSASTSWMGRAVRMRLSSPATAHHYRAENGIGVQSHDGEDAQKDMQKDMQKDAAHWWRVELQEVQQQIIKVLGLQAGSMSDASLLDWSGLPLPSSSFAGFTGFAGAGAGGAPLYERVGGTSDFDSNGASIATEDDAEEEEEDDHDHEELEVTCVRAEGLAKADGMVFGLVGGKSDPYCTILWNGLQVAETKVIDNTTSPEWGESFHIPLHEVLHGPLDESSLVVEVYDHDKLGSHDFLGQITVNGAELAELRQRQRAGFTTAQGANAEGANVQHEAIGRVWKLQKKEGGAKQKLVKGDLTLRLRLLGDVYTAHHAAADVHTAEEAATGAAAVKIQASVRGKRDRKKAKGKGAAIEESKAVAEPVETKPVETKPLLPLLPKPIRGEQGEQGEQPVDVVGEQGGQPIIGGSAALAAEISDAALPPRQRLVAFYETHNPSKLGDVEKTLERYAGREDQLFEKLEAKYGVAGSTCSDGTPAAGPQAEAHAPADEVGGADTEAAAVRIQAQLRGKHERQKLFTG
jgi:hypothetical protein